jgi:VanZ family protein
MKFRYLLPAFLWSVIILLIICIPGSNFPKTPFINIPHLDKLVHAFIFAILAYLLSSGLYRQKNPYLKKHHYAISLAAGIVYGIFTEWIQWSYIPGRSGELLDWIADVGGTLAGLLFFWFQKNHFSSHG